MHEIESDALADVHPELAEAVVAVGDPVAEVLKRREREPDHEADDRQRPAGDPSARDDREPGADHARSTPQPAICHGVHGPCPKKKFDVSAAIAPTTKPGAPPSA